MNSDSLRSSVMPALGGQFLHCYKEKQNMVKAIGKKKSYKGSEFYSLESSEKYRISKDLIACFLKEDFKNIPNSEVLEHTMEKLILEEGLGNTDIYEIALKIAQENGMNKKIKS